MRTVFIECDRDLSAQQRKAMIAEMEYAAGDDVRIVLLAPGMRVAEPAPQWIPVSERLPEHGGWFIVTKDGEEGNKHVFLSWFSTAHGWEFAEEPIAWMPLPEPYTEDKR